MGLRSRTAGLAAIALWARAAAQDAAPLTRTLSGSVTGARDARIRVSAWLLDLRRRVTELFGECVAAVDGSFVLREIPWFGRQEWSRRSIVLVAN